MVKRITPTILQNNDFCSCLKELWDDGLFDEFSDNHFLIMALNDKLKSFKWSSQFINNTLALYPQLFDERGGINFKLFATNFCINFSNKISHLIDIFGRDKIEAFITNQLSAGKDRYDENAFFQAFSEIEILTFFDRGFNWQSRQYEPAITKHGKNPEACFVGTINGIKTKINIEVKTACFPNVSSDANNLVIPSILQQDKCATVNSLCGKYGLKTINPRVTKLVQFINSACEKFNVPAENELNLLYINWSFGDFPSNAFLEAWSLLTNEYNGLLVKPEISERLSLKEPLNLDFQKKISAIIVYVSSLDQLMFGDFRMVWQRNRAGCKFRLFLLDKTKKNIFEITGMNPDENATIPALACFDKSIFDNVAQANSFMSELEKTIIDNALK